MQKVASTTFMLASYAGLTLTLPITPGNRNNDKKAAGREVWNKKKEKQTYA